MFFSKKKNRKYKTKEVCSEELKKESYRKITRKIAAYPKITKDIAMELCTELTDQGYVFVSEISEADFEFCTRHLSNDYLLDVIHAVSRLEVEGDMSSQLIFRNKFKDMLAERFKVFYFEMPVIEEGQKCYAANFPEGRSIFNPKRKGDPLVFETHDPVGAFTEELKSICGSLRSTGQYLKTTPRENPYFIWSKMGSVKIVGEDGVLTAFKPTLIKYEVNIELNFMSHFKDERPVCHEVYRHDSRFFSEVTGELKNISEYIDKDCDFFIEKVEFAPGFTQVKEITSENFSLTLHGDINILKKSGLVRKTEELRKLIESNGFIVCRDNNKSLYYVVSADASCSFHVKETDDGKAIVTREYEHFVTTANGTRVPLIDLEVVEVESDEVIYC